MSLSWPPYQHIEKIAKTYYRTFCRNIAKYYYATPTPYIQNLICVLNKNIFRLFFLTLLIFTPFNLKIVPANQIPFLFRLVQKLKITFERFFCVGDGSHWRKGFSRSFDGLWILRVVGPDEKLRKKVCLRRAPFPKKIKSIQLDANFVRNGEETIHTSFQCQQGKFICEADLDHLNVFSKQNGYR